MDIHDEGQKDVREIWSDRYTNRWIFVRTNGWADKYFLISMKRLSERSIGEGKYEMEEIDGG